MAVEPTAAAPPADHAPGRFSHLKAAFKMSGAMLTAVVALTSGALALFFQLRPDLTPDPRTNLGATAEVFAVDSGVSLKAFLQRRAAIVSPSELANEKRDYIEQAGGESILTLPGEDIFVELNVMGFKSRSIGLIASMYNAKTGRRVPALSDVPVFTERLNSPSDHSVVEFWMPAPPVTVQTYFVRVQVYHRGDGVLLGIADSKPIRAA